MRDFFKSGYFWRHFVLLLWCVVNIAVGKDCLGWWLAGVGNIVAIALFCVVFKDSEKPEFSTFDKIFISAMAAFSLRIILQRHWGFW